MTTKLMPEYHSAAMEQANRAVQALSPDKKIELGLLQGQLNFQVGIYVAQMGEDLTVQQVAAAFQNLAHAWDMLIAFTIKHLPECCQAPEPTQH